MNSQCAILDQYSLAVLLTNVSLHTMLFVSQYSIEDIEFYFPYSPNEIYKRFMDGILWWVMYVE